MPLVDDGRVLVGLPGAPGWTTTGVAGSACCAETDSDNKQTTVTVATLISIDASTLQQAALQVRVCTTATGDHGGPPLQIFQDSST